MWWRIIVLVAVAALIVFGLRRIWLDWSRRFRELDRQDHVRDVAERERPDVITLERGEDGTFRPPEKAGKDDR